MQTQPSHDRAPRYPEAFTLIEILVVVTILAILVLLAVPAISGIKSKGLASKSLANIRQCYAGLQMYASDNSGNFPPPVDSNSPPKVRWSTLVYPYIYGKDTRPGDSALLNTVFISPGCTRDLVVRQLGQANVSNSYVQGYAINGMLPANANISEAQRNPKNPKSAINASRTMLLIDASQAHLNWFAWEQSKTRLENGSERYAGKNTTVYLDGHAEMLVYSNIPGIADGTGSPAAAQFWKGEAP